LEQIQTLHPLQQAHPKINFKESRIREGRSCMGEKNQLAGTPKKNNREGFRE